MWRREGGRGERERLRQWRRRGLVPREVGLCSCGKQGCGADEGMLMDGLEPNCAEKKKGE